MARKVAQHAARSATREWRPFLVALMIAGAYLLGSLDTDCWSEILGAAQ